MVLELPLPLPLPNCRVKRLLLQTVSSRVPHLCLFSPHAPFPYVIPLYNSPNPTALALPTHLGYVQPPRGDVGADQVLRLAAAELVQVRLTLLGGG